MCRDNCLKVQVKDVMIFTLYAQTGERANKRGRKKSKREGIESMSEQAHSGFSLTHTPQMLPLNHYHGRCCPAHQRFVFTFTQEHFALVDLWSLPQCFP